MLCVWVLLKSKRVRALSSNTEQFRQANSDCADQYHNIQLMELPELQQATGESNQSITAKIKTLELHELRYPIMQNCNSRPVHDVTACAKMMPTAITRELLRGC